jgi:hypothetical protein
MRLEGSRMTGTETSRVCVLPGGYRDDKGVLHREAELAQLSGREEEMLAGMPEVATPSLVTRILSRCVRRIGSIRPVTEQMARSLLIADRQYLLLKLRELTFGSRVEGTLSCPWPQCGTRVDVDFSIADVPVKPLAAVAAICRVELSPEAVEDAAGTPQQSLSFRLPNGEDQEILAPALARNPAEALTHLLERCLTGMETGGEDVHDRVARLSSRARQEIERAMEECAPHVELEMALVCPECGREFTAPFDLQDFFFGELRTSRDLLYRQVHYLAYHYHWSEREIMKMPREKRLAYIEVLAEEIEALNDVR